MKKIFLFLPALFALTFSSCKKDKETFELQRGPLFTIGICHSIPLSGMLYNAGFNNQDPQISENNFPIEQSTMTDTISGQLISFTNKVTFEEAEKAITAHGWHVLKIDALAAYAEQYPEMQGKVHVVALGSFSGEGRNKISPSIEIANGNKNLVLLQWKGGGHHYGYQTDYYFMAVH